MYHFLADHCENSTSSLGQEEVSLAGCFADIPPYVLSRLNLTAERSYSKDSETEYCQSSQSGTMSQHSTETLGEGRSMSFAEGSLAPISQMPTNGIKMTQGCQVLMASEEDCGLKCLELFAKFDQESYSWKMCQTLLNLELETSSEIWPQSGIMQDGVCWEAEIAEEFINVTDYGFSLFTPTATDYKRNNLSSPMWDRRMQTRKSAGTLPEQLAWMGLKGILSPTFVEKMMRFPISWTDLRPLEMHKIQLWQQWHGKFSQNNQ